MLRSGSRFEVRGSRLKINRIAAVCAISACGVLAGCRQDMHDQPKFIPQRGTEFYADGRSARPQVENTVARGQLHEDAYFYTGMQDGKEGNAMPFPVTMEVLERGQERYNIYCQPCHSQLGDGNGMIVQRGYKRPPSFHVQRLKNAPLGWFYDVISNGFGGMPDYAAQVKPADRWAIAAYIRALQLSQNAQEGDVASADRDKLNQPAEEGIRIPDTSLVSPAVTTPVTPVQDTTPKGNKR